MLYSYDIALDQFVVHHNFQQSTGFYPSASLTRASNGVLYGVTQFGGAYDAGILFSFDLSTDTYNVLVDFSNVNGFRLWSRIIELPNQILLSTTENSGALQGTSPVLGGTVFTYDISTGQHEIMRDFSQSVGRDIFHSTPIYVSHHSVGIGDNELDQQLTIYPNPSDGVINHFKCQRWLLCHFQNP